MSKRLMPTYLVNFLKEIYDGTIPSNFGERMVSRQFIASVKDLYETLGGDNPNDYSRRMVNEYLIKFFNEIEIVEYTDDDVLMTKTIPSDLVYPACRVDAIGGMSYVVDGAIQDSTVTAVKAYNTDNELLDTYTVPSAITSLDGYGKGISNTVYNNVDFASGKYIKKVGVLTIDENTTYSYNSPSLRACTTATTNVKNNGSLIFYSTNSNIVAVACVSTGVYFEFAEAYESNNAMHEALIGTVVYYELVTPVETTITEQAPLLEVEEGGSVVFENKYNQNMPNEVTVWIKEN